MEFKRTNSSRGPVSSARGAAAGTTPLRSNTPTKQPLSARGSGTPTPTKKAIPPMPPRSPLPGSARGAGANAAASPVKPPVPASPSAGKFERSSSKTGGSSKPAAFERSNSTTGSKNAFKRTNSSASGFKKNGGEGGKNNRVNVYVRVRAFRADETGDLAKLAVEMRNSDCVEVNVPKKGPFKFNFDGCFWSNDRPCSAGMSYTSQEDVFDVVGRPLVENALAGYNASVMAYGQTGSGKTYTSFGPAGSLGTADEGLVPRVCNMLFMRAASGARNGVNYAVRASMLEVYLEDVYDLLNHRKQLSLRNDVETSTFQVVGAKAVPVHNYNDVMHVLNKAEPLRTFAATNIHDHSSRAHTLFMLEVTTTFSSGDMQPRCAKILLADLAGCERIKLAGTEEGLAFEQARNINLSLLALGSCIEAVAARGNDAHKPIPEFRNSTLTKLLKDYLGGNSMSAMMITIGPSEADANLSVQTLRFGDRAKQITTHAKVNTVEVDPNAKKDEVYLSDQLRDEYNRRKEALYAEYQLNSAMEKMLGRMAEIEQLLKTCDEDLQLHLTAELEGLQKNFKDAEYQITIQKQIIHGDYYFMEDELRQLNAKLQQMKEESNEALENMLGAEAGRFDDMKREFEHSMADEKKRSQSLHDELQRLQALVGDLQSQLKAKEADCAELRKHVGELQGRYDKDAAAAAAKAREQGAAIEKLRDELARTAADAVGERQAAAAEQQKVAQSLQAARAELDHTKRELADAQSSNVQNSLLLTALRHDMEEQTEAHEQQQKEVGAEAAQLHTQLQKATAKLEDTQAKLEETAAQLQKRGAAADSYSEELQQTQAKLGETEEKLQETSEQLQETATKLSETEEKLSEKTVKATQTESRLRETAAKLQQTEAKLEATEDQLRQQVTLGAALQREVAQAKEAHASAADFADREATKLHEQLGETTQQLRATVAKLEDTQARLRETQAQLQERGAAADHLNEEVSHLQAMHATEVRAAEEREAELHACLAEKEAEIQEFHDKLGVTSEKLQETAAMLEQTESQLEEASEQLQERGAAADSYSEELQQTQAKLGETEEKLSETTEQLQETAAKLADTEGRLQETSEQLEDTQAKLEETAAQLQERGAAADHLDAELQELQATHAAAMQAAADREADLARTLEQKEVHLDETIEQLQETALKLAGAEAQLEQTEDELRETTERLGGEVAALEVHLAHSQQEVAARDTCLAAAVAQMDARYEATLEGLTTLQGVALHDVVAQAGCHVSEIAQRATEEIERMRDLYESADEDAKENAMRFNMLRQVLGKIDKDVKQATTMPVESKSTRTARGTSAAALGDLLLNRGSSLSGKAGAATQEGGAAE